MITSLRDRMGDVQYLSEEILNTLATEQGIESPGVEEDAKNKLLSHYWTHNMSELISVMEESFKNSDKKTITVQDLAPGRKKSYQRLQWFSPRWVKVDVFEGSREIINQEGSYPHQRE